MSNYLQEHEDEKHCCGTCGIFGLRVGIRGSAGTEEHDAQQLEEVHAAFGGGGKGVRQSGRRQKIHGRIQERKLSGKLF